MKLEYSDEAAAALDEYEDSDPDLYWAADAILELLENDDANPLLRRRLIRPANAFVVEVRLSPPRDRPYYLFWQPEEDQNVAFIKYVGPGERRLY